MSYRQNEGTGLLFSEALAFDRVNTIIKGTD